MKRAIGKRLASGLGMALLLMAGASFAAPPPPPAGYRAHPRGKNQPNFDDPVAELKPAKNIEPLPSGSVELRVGEKVSYSTKNVQVAMANPDIARMTMNDKGILTILPKRRGQSQLFVFPGGGKGGPPSADSFKNPKIIRVTVR